MKAYKGFDKNMQFYRGDDMTYNLHNHRRVLAQIRLVRVRALLALWKRGAR